MCLSVKIVTFSAGVLCFSNAYFSQVWFDIAAGGSIGTAISSDFELYDDTRIDVAPRASSNAFLKKMSAMGRSLIVLLANRWT